MSQLRMVALLAALSVIAALVAFMVADQPVSRRRVERFARLHSLDITADNGAPVIGYLATIRRWRAAGLIGALTAYTVVDLRHSRISVNIMYLLAGWFVGALLAEVRVAGVLSARRAASLTPRVRRRYLSPLVSRVLVGAVLVYVALAVAAASRVGVRGDGGQGVGSLVAVAVVVVMVWLASRRVLHRAQPLAAADVLAADDAIRSRSLHALTASGAILVLYCALGPLSELAAAGPAALILIGTIALPYLGWRLATSRWVVQPVATPPDPVPA